MPQDSPAVVLVVDDTDATRYYTSRILRSVGMTVREAATGSEALAAAAEKPDLIVLDINLPDMDGFEVCRAIRGMPSTAHTPIVYLSATFVDDLDKVHGVDAGADGYLTHPVEAPVLIGAVNALLRARRAEAALHESEANFKAVFDRALSGIALLTDDLIFLEANPAVCGFLGRPKEEVIGRHISAFSPKELSAETEMAASLGSTGSWRGYAPVIHTSGTLVDLEWSVTIHSRPGIRLAMMTDVTERRANEAEREHLLVSERRARADAEHANQLKDDFLAALSHELRTPLNAIVGFSHVLKHHALAEDTDARFGIEAIARNAKVLSQLIADLLDVSAITSGKLQLDREWIEPGDVLRTALASAKSAADAKQVVVNVELGQDVDRIFWDLTRLQQVIWNLVDNAVKFSSPGGKVDVSLHQTETEVMLTVRDYGRGMAGDFVPHVFDRFRQEHSGSKRWFGGLGLGLAIVQQLVHAHGASITASSEGEGLGATFVVRWQRTSIGSDHVAEAEPPEEEATDLGGLRVLIVEDDADARRFLRRLIVGASAECREAGDVDTALLILAEFEPDVLVSDIGMPSQDGYDLIRRVRQGGWTAERLPAIALTAFARPEDRERALKAGYQAHLAKPIEAGHFISTVRQFVTRRS